MKTLQATSWKVLQRDVCDYTSMKEFQAVFRAGMQTVLGNEALEGTTKAKWPREIILAYEIQEHKGGHKSSMAE